MNNLSLFSKFFLISILSGLAYFSLYAQNPQLRKINDETSQIKDNLLRNNTFEIRLIRGKIKSGNSLLKKGDFLDIDTPFSFTYTTDVMLVSPIGDYEVSFFIKPDNFTISVKDGSPIKNHQETLRKSIKVVNLFISDHNFNKEHYKPWEDRSDNNFLWHIVTEQGPNSCINVNYIIENVKTKGKLEAQMITETSGSINLSHAMVNKNQLWKITKAFSEPYCHLATNHFFLESFSDCPNILNLSLFRDESREKWNIIPAEADDIFYIRNASNGYYLGSTHNNKVQMAPFSGKVNQQWRIQKI